MSVQEKHHSTSYIQLYNHFYMRGKKPAGKIHWHSVGGSVLSKATELSYYYRVLQDKSISKILLCSSDC